MQRRTLLRAATALAAGGALTAVAAPAAASEYPSWGDVLAARKSAAKKTEAMARIRDLVTAGQREVERTQRVANDRGSIWANLREQVDTANDRLAAIRAEVARDRKKAQASTQRAGQLAAQLSRTGGADLQATLFLSAGSSAANANGFLARLGQLSKLTQNNGSIAEQAKRAQLVVAATEDQLKTATAELVKLKDRARRALDDAIDANTRATQELDRQKALQITLAAQLEVLQAKTATTYRAYQAGIDAKRQAQRDAGSGGPSGSVVSSGWALPESGPITSPFGYRPDRPAGAQLFHHGTDIGCPYGSAIYAAHAGTVVYAGWLGTYGYFVEISHGSGISTGYAHVRPGGIFVHVGQEVSAGQNIASVGTTGASTGPHLHFEVRYDEVARDSVPFMAARGVQIG